MRHLTYLSSCLFHALRNGPFEAIVSYDPLLCGLGGVLVKGITRAKLVIEVNSDHFWTMNDPDRDLRTQIINRIKTVSMRLCFRYSDGIKFVNTTLKDKYSKLFALDKKQIALVTFFNFQGIRAFRYAGPNPNGPILCVGHPYNIKGVDVLLKAFISISEDYPNTTLKIIGHDEDIRLYEELAEGNTNVSFHKGMSFDRIVPEFENCRFFVLASRTEGRPRVIAEAMASGKAVIGSRVGGIPEVIEENDTGLLFESENHAELADKMRKLLDDPALVERMGAAGYERVNREFAPERYTELYYDFLEDIIAGETQSEVSGTKSSNI